MTFAQLIQKPSGYCPVGMSLVALMLVALAIRFGAAAVVPPGGRMDEGALAHVFQLLIVAHLPVVALFIWRWARGNVLGAMQVLAVQELAVALALTPVVLYRL